MNAARQYLELLTSERYTAFMGGRVNPVAKFVLDNGREFSVGPDTFKGRRGKRGLCFMNATNKAIGRFDLHYVEGFVTVHGVALQHAWNVDGAGHLIEPTLPNDGLVRDYFGVEFGTDYLLDAIAANGVYGLLDGFHNRKTLADLIEGRANWKPEEVR